MNVDTCDDISDDIKGNIPAIDLTQEHVSNDTNMQDASQIVIIDDEPGEITDLPDSILKRLEVINNDVAKRNQNKKTKNMQNDYMQEASQIVIIDDEPGETPNLPDSILKGLVVISNVNKHNRSKKTKNMQGDNIQDASQILVTNDEPGEISDLPDSILKRLEVINNDEAKRNRNKKTKNMQNDNMQEASQIAIIDDEPGETPDLPGSILKGLEVISNVNKHNRSKKTKNMQDDNIQDASQILVTNDEPGEISDLPDSILKRLEVINNNVAKHNRSKKAKNIPNLVEGGGSGLCNFLLDKTIQTSCQAGKVDSTSSRLLVGSNNLGEIGSDSDDDLTFPISFMERRMEKRNHMSMNHDGADEREDCKVNEDIPIFVDSSEPILKKDELDEIFDLMSEYRKDIEAKPCKSIQCSMLPHQKMALHWMISRENSKELPPFWECIQEGCDYFNLGTRNRTFERPQSINGGILADDMGMGKTLTVIALILTNHIHGKTLLESKNKLPVDASEICESNLNSKKRKAVPLKVKVTKREFKKPGFKFRQMYLENMQRKLSEKKRRKTKEVDFSFSDNDDDSKQMGDVIKHISSIVTSMPEFTNNPSSKRNKFGEIDSYRTTSLIVCPMSVLSNWSDQIQQHVDPSLNLQMYLYYGPDRVKDSDFLRKFDIILTTYGTLSFEYREMDSRGKSSPLFDIKWLRVVLDEGHVIRNFHSRQSTAARHLDTTRRWILTGTPIQNRMTDLWSMINFLGIEPFTDKSWWIRHVINSIGREARPGEICFNRIQKIVKHIAIRRLKTDVVENKPIVNLPNREVVIQKIEFSEEERKIYDVLQKDGKLVISQYFQRNAVLKNYANILVIIMRLRQLCCHPKLCTKAVQKVTDLLKAGLYENENDNNIIGNIDGMSEENRERLVLLVIQLISAGDSEECSICLETLRDPVVTKCAHVFCSTCINEVIEFGEAVVVCPLCRSEINQASLVNVRLNEGVGDVSDSSVNRYTELSGEDVWRSSAKVNALLDLLMKQREEDPSIKSLVVSQFTSFLDILEEPLKLKDFMFVRLDGRISQAKRVDVIEEFMGDHSSSPTIMLLSLTAGGVGLNLAAASRVFLLDPAWNPAVEEQCFDRCHRLGQTKDVKIFKFIIKDTVEERMLILQEEKRKLMQKAFGTIQQTSEQRRNATLNDIRTLMDLHLPGGYNENPLLL